MGKALEFVLNIRDNASPQLKVLDKEARKAAGGFEETEKAAESAGDALANVGDKAEATSKDFGKLGKAAEATEDRAGQLAGVAGALATGLDKVSPAAGAAVRGLGDMATAAQGAGGGLTMLMGPVGVLTAVVAVGGMAWQKYSDDLEEAEQKMRDASAAVREMAAIVKTIKTTEARLELEHLVATGQAASEELMAVQAEEAAAAKYEPLIGKQRGTLNKVTVKLNEALREEAKLRDNLRSNLVGDLPAYEKAQQASRRLMKSKNREIGALSALENKQDRLSESYYKTAMAIKTAGKSSSGGAKQLSDFEAMLLAADKLAAPTTTKLENLTNMLGALKEEAGKSENKTRMAARAIENLTVARDAEKAAIEKTRLQKLTGELDKVRGKTIALVGQMDSLTQSFGEPLTALQKLKAKKSQFEKTWAGIAANAQEAGVESTEHFAIMKSKFRTKMLEMQGIIDKLEVPGGDKLTIKTVSFIGKVFAGIAKHGTSALVALTKPLHGLGESLKSFAGWSTKWIPEKFKTDLKNEFMAIGSALKGFLTGGTGTIGGAIGVVQSGGASALTGAVGGMAEAQALSGGATGQAAAAAGMGAAGAAGAAMQLGMGGAQQYEQAKSEKAQEIATQRQEKMAKKREKLLEEGLSEEQLAEQGLSQEDVAGAGEVTRADEAKAMKEVDRGEEMGKFVEGLVEGVIQGIISLIVGLPDILETVIPLLVTELVPALISAALRMIPKMLKMLFYGLPKALGEGFIRGFNKVWRAISQFFREMFSIGKKQSGGYIPKTGRYVLHQGERVMPASGTATGTARGLAAFTGGGGPSLTVNASVVDPDTIPALSKIIDKSMGSYGRTTNPIFGTKNPITSI